MDNTTYPGSDTDVNETYENCDFYSMASNELDFVDHWVNLTVEKEILRGSKLREGKLRSCPQQDEYEIVNINLIRPPCVEINTSYRKQSPGRTKVKTGSCSPRSNSPFLRQNSSSRAYTPTIYSRPNTPSFKAKCAPRCPMRIAELACPTKRQCIDTWRNKCDVLPAFMVERLRQQIMDEKPVVKITEAISCFKRRKPKSVKSIRSRKQTRDSKLKNEKMDVTRNLCATFANRIMQRLITPQNLKLTPELENISKIVADELTNIIQNRKKLDLDVVSYKRIQAEIADKITIWIATILEDTSYKILEEDLRVKNHSDRKNVKEERIDTLIGKLPHHEKSSDLEEEEGPVLDFIDDLVDNVVTICEPQGMDIEENDNISERTSKASYSIINNDFDSSTLNTNITYDTGEDTIHKSNETEPVDSTTSNGFIQDNNYQSLDQTSAVEGVELNLNDHFRKELLEIVDFIIPANNDDNIEMNHIANDKDIDKEIEDALDNETDFNLEYKDLQRSPGNSELASQIKQVQSDPELELVEDVVQSSKNSLEDGMDHSMDDPKSNIENVNAENDQVSVLLDEESLDEKNKRVKFSAVDTDVGGTPRKLDSNSVLVEENGNEKERVSWHSSTDLHSLVFGPPNEYLLSDADELWPNDIKTPVLKPSASVNRSVTSLGKILEKDEKSFLEDEIISTLNWEAMDHAESEILYQTDANNRKLSEELENIQKLIKAQIAAEIKNESEADFMYGNSPEDVTKETGPFINTIETREDEVTTAKTVEANVPLLQKSNAAQIEAEIKNESNADFTLGKLTQDATDETAPSINTLKREDKVTTAKSVEAVSQEPETKRLISDSSTSPFEITITDTSKNNQELKKEKQTKKDIKNLESDTNVIYEAVQQKMKSSYAMAEPKHDYKVDAKTAPSWLQHDHGKGEPSEDSFQGGKSKGKLKETDIRNWCNDLDRIFVNLEMWNGWVDKTCKKILYLKQKREMNKLFVPNARKKDARDWTILKKNIDKDSVLWTKLNQRAYEKLKTYKHKTKYQQPAEAEMLNINHDNFETVLETLQEIDRICVWMHRTIVSTEYCTLCDCKNYTKRKV